MLGSVGRINPQWHAAERAKGPRSTSSPAHKPFKSLPPSVLFFPKCNYKPGEGGYCRLGSLQNTASTPALGGIKRPGCASKASPHLTALYTVAPPSYTRLTPRFQHHWVLRFSPRRTELVWPIKTKKRISLLDCIITSMNTLCTYAHIYKCAKPTCVHTLPPTVTEI